MQGRIRLDVRAASIHPRRKLILGLQRRRKSTWSSSKSLNEILALKVREKSALIDSAFNIIPVPIKTQIRHCNKSPKSRCALMCSTPRFSLHMQQEGQEVEVEGRQGEVGKEWQQAEIEVTMIQRWVSLLLCCLLIPFLCLSCLFSQLMAYVCVCVCARTHPSPGASQ